MSTTYLSIRKTIVYVFLTLTIGFPIHLYSQVHPPKREFRGTWIATTKNIDWPTRSDLSAEEQQAELITLLDKCQEAGLNAIVFQARPAGEVFYDSPYEPWSQFLTGELGKVPDPFYDPLAFIIEEAHKRGMELHAWVNPFRSNLNWNEFKSLPTSHIASRFPDWTISYGEHLYLDPGNPLVREYLIKIVIDIVKRYEIDAIHVDDYFYPYKIPGLEFSDKSSFRRYNPDRLDLEDWRRSNINQFVHALSDSIYAHKPMVELGISPFGVWRNKKDDDRGSETRSLSSYDDLYADVLHWMENGWIDYVVPQLYWSRGYSPADFSHLLDWWAKNRNGTKLYIGHALYKVDNNADKKWENPEEIPEQIRLVRRFSSVSGSVLFSSKWLLKNPLGVSDSLRENHYYYPSLTPMLTRSRPQEILAPINLEIDSHPEGLSMIWDDEGFDGMAKYYVVYRNKGKQVPLALPEYQWAVLRSSDLYFLDKKTSFLKKYTYAISAVDPMGNESELSNIRSQRRWSGLFSKKSKKKRRP